jgi:hypothetical protein
MEIGPDRDSEAKGLSIGNSDKRVYRLDTGPKRANGSIQTSGRLAKTAVEALLLPPEGRGRQTSRVGKTDSRKRTKIPANPGSRVFRPIQRRSKRPTISPICSAAGGRLLRQVYVALNCVLIVVQVLAVLCALAQPAYAYTDPGAGLLALQLISTTFAGIIFMIRKRLRRLFRIKPSELKSEEDAQK